jgi:signal transduction histidine kinase
MVTQFAPPQRSTQAELEGQSRHFISVLGSESLVMRIPSMLLVLNKNRQIIFANNALLNLVKKDSLTSIIGLRPGELLDCVHAYECESGCGTTIFCSTCGAVRAILSSLTGKEDIQECRITQKKTGDALDLRVWTYPVQYENEPFALFVLMDISNEKRRRVLEQIFFHDVMNTANNLQGFSELLKLATPEELERLQVKDTIAGLTHRLIDELTAQRQLLAAENNDLTVTPTRLNALDVIKGIVELYRHNDLASDKNITIAPDAEECWFESDKVLVSRVISNMLKNGLEASTRGQTVTLGCKKAGRLVQFWVNNPSFIPLETQLQIFQRSFSTKGHGRGIGTYSIKLISERYLTGSVSFASSEKGGTTFTVRYPLSLRS